MKKYWILLSFFCCFFVYSQKTMQGQILDYDTSIPISFAKITYNNKTINSDWEGKFSLVIQEDSKPILVSYKGYYDKTYYQTVGAKYLTIKLISNSKLKEKEIYSEAQVNAILKKVVENKSKNQPEKVLKNFEYKNYENDCHYTFDINSNAIITEKGDCNFEITYPKMKATIYLSYKPVNNNIKLLLQDAQKLTYEHVIKADDILEQPYINFEKRVFGMFYQVDGNAATNTQFYVTDSTKNFVAGSVYFYAKPNFDSIMPAASYIKNDVQNLMESLKWKK